MRSPAEALRSLTKFMTIIIIALSLEAGREKQFAQLVYPTAVMAAAILALVGLGAFQSLSRRSQRAAAAGSDDADASERAPQGRRHRLSCRDHAFAAESRERRRSFASDTGRRRR